MGSFWSDLLLVWAAGGVASVVLDLIILQYDEGAREYLNGELCDIAKFFNQQFIWGLFWVITFTMSWYHVVVTIRDVIKDRYEDEGEEM